MTECQRGGEDVTRRTRAWNFFLLIPRLLLVRLARGGLLPKAISTVFETLLGQWPFSCSNDTLIRVSLGQDIVRVFIFRSVPGCPGKVGCPSTSQMVGWLTVLRGNRPPPKAERKSADPEPAQRRGSRAPANAPGPAGVHGVPGWALEVVINALG